MKRFLIVALISMVWVSCKNEDIAFPDYKYSSGYFPYQFPVRTLILGDDIYDNSNDNAHQFVISAAMGGKYSNDKERKFTFEVDESLCDDVTFNGSNRPIKALPKTYYTLSSDSEIVIPKGEVNGGITVQLTDAFFDDPDAFSTNYVVPLRLIGSNDVDSILTGFSNNTNADIRLVENWVVAPKNFTMFGIKYINEYHGTYFQYGECTVKNASGDLLNENKYSEVYVEQNPTTKLITSGRHQVSLTVTSKAASMAGSFQLLLDFDGNLCEVSAPPGANYTVSGTGNFKSDAYSWGNKLRNGLELTYSIDRDGLHYEAKDNFVVRDRGVVMEVFTPQL